MRIASILSAVIFLAACDGIVPQPAGTGSIEITALAGPTCPVESVPPRPACAPRAVAGARIVVTPADGRDVVVAEGATDVRGLLRLDVPVGEYLVTAGDVEGLMGLPEPMAVSVKANEVIAVVLSYDTGIR